MPDLDAGRRERVEDFDFLNGVLHLAKRKSALTLDELFSEIACREHVLSLVVGRLEH